MYEICASASDEAIASGLIVIVHNRSLFLHNKKDFEYLQVVYSARVRYTRDLLEWSQVKLALSIGVLGWADRDERRRTIDSS